MKHRHFNRQLLLTNWDQSTVKSLSTRRLTGWVENAEKEIKNFMRDKCYDDYELNNDQRFPHFCVFADITEKLNELSHKLQAEDKLITDCSEDTHHLSQSLKRNESQLESKNANIFPLLKYCSF